MMMRKGILVNARNRHCERSDPVVAWGFRVASLLRFSQRRQFYSPIGIPHEKKPGS
jgi:hypothetical protein